MSMRHLNWMRMGIGKKLSMMSISRTSPVNAMKMTRVICDVLSEADPIHKAIYKDREEAYQKELQDIDEGFRQVSENRKRSMIIVGDKFPFRYLAEEYRLDYRAAFSGCSTDTEPVPEP